MGKLIIIRSSAMAETRSAINVTEFPLTANMETWIRWKIILID